MSLRDVHVGMYGAVMGLAGLGLSPWQRLAVSLGGPVTDEDQFAGMIREQVIYNGVDTKPVSKTVNVPWRSPATASRTRRPRAPFAMR